MHNSRTPNGWKGVIEHGGGTQAIHPEEHIEFENAGIYVYHNDKYDTCTFLPIFTVRMVRWHSKEAEKAGPNVSAKELSDQDIYQRRVRELTEEKRMLGQHEEESE